MRTQGVIICILALIPVAIFAAAADEIELAGILTEKGKVTVLLKDKVSGRTRWVLPGEGIGGYTYVSFNDKTETATVSKDGANAQLRMKTSKVLSTTATPAGQPPAPPGIPALQAAATPQAAVDRAILNNLRQLGAAADQYYLENGVSKATLADLVGQDKYVRQLITVGGEDYSKLEFGQGKALVVPLPDGRNITYAQ